ncbi:MAG TPA: TonB-dependent receptor plug domain-containing protein, partial [Longimicrobiales bacterium]
MKLRRFVIAVSVLLVSHSSAFAQDPVPPRDTTRVPVDTARADTAQPPVFQDSVRPIPQLARHYFPAALGLSDGVWEWDQQALLLEASTSLADLLERIPGILPVRTGLLVQPEGAAAFGGTANRVEVLVDGYALDPLTESSVDIGKIELANVERVRIERRIGLIRIHIETLAPKDNRTYSRVEAGVSEPEANMFRGVLLAPKLFVGPFGVAIARMDTDGLGRNEPGDQFAGWLKWSFIRGKSGFQVEYRRVSTDRDQEIPWPAEHSRDDLIARLRLNIREGIVAELFGGRSTFEADTADPAEEADTL